MNGDGYSHCFKCVFWIQYSSIDILSISVKICTPVNIEILNYEYLTNINIAVYERHMALLDYHSDASKSLIEIIWCFIIHDGKLTSYFHLIINVLQTVTANQTRLEYGSSKLKLPLMRHIRDKFKNVSSASK